MKTDFIKTRTEELCAAKDIRHLAESLTMQDRDLIMKHASDLKNNTFVFDKPWDMERCIIPYHLETIDWEMDPNGDEEWCFMLNRMDYLSYLMYATLITGDLSYQIKGKELILDWIDHHETITPMRSTRTLDTGIRVMNIFEALPYLWMSKILTDNELTWIANSLFKQIRYMKEHYLLKYITSNWGSIQTCAIAAVLPYLDDEYEKNEDYQWALHELERQMEAQVYPDGMHWEQSTMYHIEVLNYGMKAIYYLSLRNIEVPKGINDAVYRLAKALFLQATPAKEIETFGDSDRSSIQDVFCRATVIFSEPEFKYLGFETFDCESLYTLGNKSLQTYLQMPLISPEETVFDGEEAGMYVIRSGWNKMDSFTMFTNGSLGSGHGHSDNLHTSIYYKGKPLLIDAGRLTYREDDERRVRLKGMKAHNTVLIDEHEYCKPSDSWGYADFGRPLKNYVRHQGNLHYLEGSMIGHDPLSIITRKLVVIDPAIWLICDEISCDGKHKAIARFHADADVDVKAEDEKTVLLDDIAKMEFDSPVEVIADLCSIRYNEPLESKTILAGLEFENTGILHTVLYDQQIEVGKEAVFQEMNRMSDDVVTALTFKLSDDEEYTVVIFHQEVFKGKKVIFCKGMPFHAKCVVIHEKQGVRTLTKLKM